MCRLHICLILTSAIFTGCDETPRTKVPTAKSAIISVDTPVKSVAFALDKTAMTPEEFNFLRNSVAKAVTELKPSEQFSVIAYDEKVYTVWEGVKTANADSKKIARDWLMTLEVGSQVPESLLALKEVAKSKATHIYFICNPACFSGYAKLPSIAEELKRTTSVHVIAFNDHNDAVENALRELAKTTGGDFRFLNISPSEEREVKIGSSGFCAGGERVVHPQLDFQGMPPKSKLKTPGTSRPTQEREEPETH